MSEKFTTEPYFMDSFDHIPVDFALTDKYNLDKDFTVPGGTQVLETAENIVIGDNGRNGGGCALFQEEGILRKRITGLPFGGTIGFAFAGDPKLGSSQGSFLRIWADKTGEATLHALEWTGTGFVIWSGNIFEPDHFLPYPDPSTGVTEFPITLRANNWNFLVFGAHSGEIHVPGAFSAHYLRVNGEILYEAQGFGAGDTNSRYFEVRGYEGWKLDDLWCSWHAPRIPGGDQNDPNNYLPRIPLEPHIEVLKANANGILYHEFPDLVPSGLPIQRYEYIEGLYANKAQHIDSGTEIQDELHNFENVPTDLNIYAVQATMLMKGIVSDKRVYVAWLPSDQNPPPFTPFGVQPGSGYSPNRTLSGDTWAYYTGCSVNNTDSNPAVNLCDGTQWCPAEFNLSQFGVENIDSSIIMFGHGIIELMTDSPAPEPPDIIDLIEGTYHRFTKLWKLVRKDGTIFRFTNHNIDLVNPEDGFTYTPLLSFLTSSHQRKTGIDQNNLEIQGIIGTLTFNDFLAGKYRESRITEYLVDWQYPWAGVLLATTFILESITHHNAKWTAEAGSIVLPLLRPKGSVYGRTCRHVLGDLKCKVSLSLLEESENVLAVNSERTKFTTTLPIITDVFGNARGIPNYWAFGSLTWTNGANSGLKFEVRSDTIPVPEQQEIILQTPTPFDIVVGDVFTITPGCDKLWSTCKDKFENPTDGDFPCGNTKNFGGFPTIPGKDGIFSPIGEANRVFSDQQVLDWILNNLLPNIL